MNYLLSYTIFYAFLLILACWILSRQYDKRWLLWLGIVLGSLLLISMQHFVAVNFNKCVGLGRHFNLFGLNMIFYISCVVILVNIVSWLFHRKVWPSVVLLVLGGLQILFYFLLHSHFSLANASPQ